MENFTSRLKPADNFERFTPSQVALLSGISEGRQGLYRSKGYCQFLSDTHKKTKGVTYTWDEACCFALMNEISNLGFTYEQAGWVATSNSRRRSDYSFKDYKTTFRGTVATIFDADHRRQEDGDRPLYILCFPDLSDPKSFIRTTLASGEVDFDGSNLFGGRFGFWINFSDFQKRIVARYEGL